MDGFRTSTSAPASKTGSFVSAALQRRPVLSSGVSSTDAGVEIVE